MNRSPLRACCALLCLLACAKPPPAPVELRVGVTTVPTLVLFFVAEDRHLFERHGLRVNVTAFQSGRDALEAALRGEVDVATAYETPVVLQGMSGKDLAVVTTLHRADGLTGLVARAERGIQTSADLRGKRIGVTPRTSADFMFELMLAEGGVPRDQVSLVKADQETLVQSLVKGELDAAVLWVQNLFAARRELGSGGIFVASDAYTEMSVIAGRRERVAERHEALVRFLQALQGAQTLVHADPTVGTAAQARRFPNLSSEDLALVRDRSDFELGISNLLLSVLRQQTAWFERQGIERKPGYRVRHLLVPEMLESVEPDAVTVLTAASEADVR